ncbi:MAG TPA: site-specific DNA-methyltransferase [Dehalococcoidia bacterium]|nr:site-specific DNA-methyltransferase [Dehalococcoidia bacterium]
MEQEGGGTTPPGTVHEADNLDVLRAIADGSVHLIYTDPPFNTGTTQRRTTIRTTADVDGDRTGFKGRRYRTQAGQTQAYADRFDDYLGFLQPRLVEMHRVLAETGTLYLHLDPREAHYVKVLCDEIFGRDCFLNEIVWAYDYGGRPKRHWPAKHDTILVYVKDPASHTFNLDEIDRIPYKAPGLVGPEKASKGKLPTDVWWHTIVPTNSREKTGYPTQKPVALAERIIRASSNPGELVLDPFAGSGTVGAAAAALGRRFVLVDLNPEAITCMRDRLPTETEFHDGSG